MATKRTLESFFKPTSKKARVAEEPIAPNAIPDSEPEEALPPSNHPTYPFPIPVLPSSIASRLSTAPASRGRVINDQPDLDLVYYEPYIPQDIETRLFHFLRRSLPFYRVEYKIQRGGVSTQIRTPRFTTVFGVDETSKFTDDGSLVDSSSRKPIPKDRYRCRPRPIPACLEILKKSVEKHSNETFNFCLVNYYATGEDSISYHSDDERFLGPNPTIASFSLGARRDFLMKHKPSSSAPSYSPPTTKSSSEREKPLKFALESGNMLLMRGSTQSNWLHSIPKRSSKSILSGGGRGSRSGAGVNVDKGGKEEIGRINITFRKAMVRGGTENYYTYNVGSSSSSSSSSGTNAGANAGVKDEGASGGANQGGEKKAAGGVYKWDDIAKEMILWNGRVD